MRPRTGRPRASASSGTTGAASPPTTAAGRVAGGWRGALRAVRVQDPGGASLRRAARVAIVVPPMAAFAGTIAGDPAATTFAVFATFALLGLADFGGPTIPRACAYAGATVVGAVLVLLGTLASGGAWSAVAGTALVAFVVQFLGGEHGRRGAAVAARRQGPAPLGAGRHVPRRRRLPGGRVRLPAGRRRPATARRERARGRDQGGPGRSGVRVLPDRAGVTNAAGGDLGTGGRRRQRRPVRRGRDGVDGPARLPYRRVPAVRRPDPPGRGGGGGLHRIRRAAPAAPRSACPARPGRADTRDAVVGCLRAWRGVPGSPLGPTAIGLATAWFWSAEIAGLGDELARPLAAVAAAAQSPWWR
jgi:hypothetical protein